MAAMLASRIMLQQPSEPLNPSSEHPSLIQPESLADRQGATAIRRHFRSSKLAQLSSVRRLTGKLVRQVSRSQTAGQIRRGIRHLAAPVLLISVLAFCGGTGVAAFLWLTTLPPLPDCKRLSPFTSETNKLYCAEQAARSGETIDLLAGFDLVRGWKKDHPQYLRSQQLLTNWSKAVLSIARNKALQDDMDGAIALVSKIPNTSSLYQDAQKEIRSWKQDWEKGKASQTGFEAAIQTQDWQAAETHLESLSQLDSPYWRHHLYTLRQQLITLRLDQQRLRGIQQATGSNAPEELGRLIRLAEQINPDSKAHAQTEAELKRLNGLLLEGLNARLAQSDLPGAIALTSLFSTRLPLPNEAKTVHWLGQAQSLINPSVPQTTTALTARLTQLWFVLAQLGQPPANPLLQIQSQALIPTVEKQLQDLTQIQLAIALASTQQPATLQAAIQIAFGITPDRPYRIYAQTLIAQWRKDLASIKDRPYLMAAQQLAAGGTIKDLKAAIAQAKRIPLGRPLRADAQAAIFTWNQQIQTLEDRPHLDQARSLAKQKKWQAAIQTAAKIPSGRALYAQAQAGIQQWTAQIQIAQDRPILDQARALAGQGNLGAAIDTAYQIADGRALSGEAQQEIGRWQAELDAIERDRRRDDYPPEEESPAFPRPSYRDSDPTPRRNTAPPGFPGDRFRELPPP